MAQHFSQTIIIRRDVEYGLRIGCDIFDSRDSALKDLIGSKKVFAVIDTGIGAKHTDRIIRYLRARKRSLAFTCVQGGERSKLASVSDRVAREIVQSGLSRGGFIIAVGGGAVLDMAGYAASRVHRGIPLINIPTTLLSQVDAGVGVKNAVNFGGYKNTLGTFYPPRYTIVDLSFLRSVSVKDLRSGLAEAIKVSILLNWDLFECLEEHHTDVLQLDFSESSRLFEIIRESIITHVRQIETDPYEMNKERPLVFGHQWAHWLEIKTKHRLSHGEAVSIGVAIDSHIALQRKLISNATFMRILRLIQACDLPLFDRWLWKGPEQKCAEMYRGLKRHQDHQYGDETLYALPKGEGDIGYSTKLTVSELKTALRYLSLFDKETQV